MYWEQLKYLQEISKCHSIHAASENLYLTPQALSMSIKALEEELGVVLLNRTSVGTSLTKSGETINALSQDILKNIDLILNINQHTTNDPLLSGELNLYATMGGNSIILNGIIKKFCRDYPTIALNIFENNFITTVLDSIYDKPNSILVLNACNTYLENLKNLYPESEYLYQPLLSSGVSAAVSTEHPLSKKKLISAKQLENTKIALTSMDDLERMGLAQIFPQNFYMQKQVSTFNNLNLYMEALLSGEYVGFLDTKYYTLWKNDAKTQLVNIPLKLKIKQQFLYICPRNILQNPCVKIFTDILNYKYHTAKSSN